MANKTINIMKSRLDELVYSGVQIEGIAATFADTEQIIREGKASNVSPADVSKVLGIKRGLEFLFDNYDEPMTFELYSKYNSIVGEGTIPRAGIMRGPGEVRVDDYYPDDVDVRLFDSIISTALDSSYDYSEAACSLVLNLSRAQFFYDGNKRSSSIMANHLLAHFDSAAAFIIKEQDRDAFLDLLVNYYHGNISLQDASWDLESMAIVSTEKALSLDLDDEDISDLSQVKAEEASSFVAMGGMESLSKLDSADIPPAQTACPENRSR